MQAVLVFLISLVFAAGSGFILIRGGDPAVGWSGLLFSGGCGAVALWDILGRRSPPAPLPFDDELPSRLFVYASKAHHTVYFLGAAGFAGSGAIMIASGKESVIGWLTVGFFGFGAVVIALRLFDFRPRLILDEFGIFDRLLGVGWIAWRDVVGMSVCSVHGNDMLCLEVVDTQIYLSRLSPWRRWFNRANRSFGFAELNVTLAGLTLGTEELMAIIEQYQAESRRAELARRGPSDE